MLHDPLHSTVIINSGKKQPRNRKLKRYGRNAAAAYASGKILCDRGISDTCGIDNDTVKGRKIRELYDVIFTGIIFFIFTEIAEAVEEIQVGIQAAGIQILPDPSEPGICDFADPSVCDNCYFFHFKTPQKLLIITERYYSNSEGYVQL